MNTTSIAQGVSQVLSSNLGIDSKDILPTTDIVTDLSADSLDQSEIIMDLEDHFDISINEREMQAWAEKHFPKETQGQDLSEMSGSTSPLRTVQGIIDFLAETYPELQD